MLFGIERQFILIGQWSGRNQERNNDQKPPSIVFDMTSQNLSPTPPERASVIDQRSVRKFTGIW